MALDALECIHSGFPNQNIFHDSIPVFKKTSNGCYLIDDRSSRQLVTIKIVRNEFCHLKEELYFLDLRPPPLLGILFLPHEPIKTAAAIIPIGSDLHRWQVRRYRTHIFRLHFEWLGIEVTWKISRFLKRKYGNVGNYVLLFVQMSRAISLRISVCLLDGRHSFLRW